MKKSVKKNRSLASHVLMTTMFNNLGNFDYFACPATYMKHVIFL